MRRALSLLLELTGAALIVYAALLVAVPLGCLVAGLFAFGVAIYVDRPDDEPAAPEAIEGEVEQSQ